MAQLPSQYKNHGDSTKPCLFCQFQTRGRTVVVHIAYGITVHLCPGHASREFRLRRNGRDFLATLAAAWTSAGCYTRQRQRALHAAQADIKREAALQERGEDDIADLPGSYRCPDVRAAIEAACAKGTTAIKQLAELVRAMLRMELKRGRIKPPSHRTLRRWRQEKRWQRPGWRAPSIAPL